MTPLTPAHAEALALLHAASFSPPERWPPQAFHTQLTLPHTFGFLHPQGALALSRAVAGEAELLTLATHPDARRQGLAQTLLAATLAEAARRGAATLFLEVAETNAPARALYARAGFTQLARRPNYYAPGTAALILAAATTA